ncbi:TonB-dependent siderophore receptor [Rubidibacter lacunae KORDI 51-2]|uniref:TonB-dependent siderophore receptor n=1 Tax=Rubidibacter lacunae KORDI 51-2 TaxID=582515 RepID=U5DQ93_9CHRO|nr:TonB-dependent receptor [Rubidibacter lacunae]ERN43017.1 TonB-dependent siderophore receptor [Rubidibacter lacunae KORDI 51-2]
MKVKWKTLSGWSLQLTVGAWLLIGHGAIAADAPESKPVQSADASISAEERSGATHASVPASTVDGWRAQAELADVVEITNVRIEETADGLRLQLATTGQLATPETSVTGNAAIADIPNAVLNLPAGEELIVSNPAAGIALVNISNLPDNQVRIAITGTDAPPAVEIGLGAMGLVANAIPNDDTVQVTDEDLIQIGVTGQVVADDYFVPDASTATRTATPILDTPASIQVIPRAVLEDQQVTALDDALQNIAGAAVTETEGRGFQINLRGFDGVPVFRDGFRLYSPNDNGDAAGQDFPEIANVERIEVLRGPASILFGQIDPGGAVNVVSKQPLDEPFYEVGLQIGSYEFVRPRIDISGPLTKDGSLLYRLNAVYQHEDSFRDFDQETDRFFIGPTLTWRPTDRTEIDFRLEYLDDERPFDTGLVAFGDGVADIPRDRILGEPDDRIESEFLSLGYDFEHRFSENWTIRNAFRFLKDNDDISATLSFPFIGGLDEATGTLNRVFAEQVVSNETLALQTNVVGEFSTWSIDHTVLIGVDLARYRLESESYTVFFPPSVRVPLNIFDPVYGAVPRPDRLDEPTTSEEIDTDSLQIYVQDQIELVDNLILVAGFNYETVSQTTTTLRGGRTTEADLSEDALSPRIGLVYKPIENLSLYANYARSFFPSATVTVEGDPLEPEEGEGFEVGVKTELLDRRLLATLAYFNLTRQNVATADPTDPRFSVATGEQQSQGVELNVIGEILPGWNVIGSYAYIDAEITEDNQFDVGNRLPGVPEHSASLWTTYEIQTGDLAGLAFSLGFNWVGDRTGDLNNSFDLDSYFLTNAAISYKRENWRIGLNVLNLFDVNYIEGTPRTRTRGIQPGDPFTVLGSIRYEF